MTDADVRGTDAAGLAPDAPIVVVGAGLAGVRAATRLHQLGHEGHLTLVGAEAHPPYDRPPLSKQVLTGKVGTDALRLDLPPHPGLELRTGTAATGIDLSRSTVALADGTTLGFAGLVLATGARVRRLPALAERPGVHVLRTIDDAEALRAELGRGPRVAVVGAGFIGLEVASSCRALGLDVTVVELLPVPLAPVLGARWGRRVAELHRAEGVDLRTGTTLEEVLGAGRVEALRLGDGSVVAADVVVVGVGVTPDTGWLEGSGVDLDDGVRTDERLRVLAGGRPLPHVVAAGDVTRWTHRDLGPVRDEHWTAATEQAEAAATTLLRGEAAPPFDTVPYFWSDQHGVKIQLVGRPRPDDDTVVVDGDEGAGRWAVAYGRDGRLSAGLGWSRPAKVMRLRQLIAEGSAYPPIL